MNFKRLTALWLVFVLALGLMPAGALASEIRKSEEADTIQIPFQVNPLYRDVYSGEDFPQAEIPEEQPEEAGENDIGADGPDIVYAATYVAADQAAVQIRNYMKSRTETFDIYVTDASSDYEALAESMLVQAFDHTGNPTEGDYLLWQYAGWAGQVTRDYVNGVYQYHYTIAMAYYTTAQQEKELDSAVAKLLNSLNVRGKSDYEKVRAVYDYICQNVTYDYTNLEDSTYTLKHTAYAALVNKTAVCQGYATLLYRLLLELGVDTRVIAGETLAGAHGWNIAKLGNVYYNLDATWDAGTGEYTYFLRNSLNFLNHLRYLDYETTQFHTTYPMSETDYVDGVEGEPEYYFVWGMCGDDAYWAIDRDRNLTIAGTGAVYDYENNGELSVFSPWVYWVDGFNNVIVKEGITLLGDNTFYNMPNITSVTLPNTLEEIGDHAFKLCKGLTAIQIPDTVTQLGRSIFEDCRSLAEVTLSSKLTQIPDSAFKYCESLKEIIIPDGVTAIYSSAFEWCVSMEKVTLSNSLQEIGFTAFNGCKALKEIDLPESLITLGSAAFENCDSLTEVTIPKNVTSADGFGKCDNLKSAYLHCSYIIYHVFSECQQLSKVVFYDTVTKINLSAFQKCQSLTKLTIPASVVWLDGYSGPDSLTELVFCGDAPQFGLYTFLGITATAYYPMGNDTWTEDVLQNYYGTITWVPYCKDHDYVSVTTPTTCIQDGVTTYTCSICQDTYTDGFQYATGQHTYQDDQDTTCDVCGNVRDLNMPTTPMYRLYNPNSGEHFYTGSVEERDNLIAATWQYEGISWNAPVTTGEPVHRLFNPNSSDHHYTMSQDEVDMLVEAGWLYEGVAWNSAAPENVPLFRLYNPNADCGSHHYTGSEEERENLVSVGWIYEGIGWFGTLK